MPNMMPYNAIEKTLSVSRFSTYRKAIKKFSSKDCQIKALKLYRWNAELSSRFFFPIHIYKEKWPLSKAFQNSLPIAQKNELLKKLGEDNEKFTSIGKLLPELKFSWFNQMLSQRHEGRIWKHCIKQVFQNAPVDYTYSQIRKELKEECNMIRDFRNRCGHHEPIFNNDNLYKIYPSIAKLIKWRCELTYSWLEQNERVTEMLGQDHL